MKKSGWGGIKMERMVEPAGLLVGGSHDLA